MFQRLENSWRLVKASGSVLRADKELLIFPVISAAATLIVTLTFFVPTVFRWATSSSVSRSSIDPLWLLFIAAFYVVQYTIVFFCNTALVGAAMMRLKGDDPSVSDGFRIASEHIGQIVIYAVISATVGMILRAISERNLLGRIVASVIGVGWNVATYLVVPVLVVENVGPLEAIKRSSSLLRQTWGEQIAGNLGISAVFGLVTIGIMIVAAPLIVAVAALKSIGLIIAVLIGLVVVLIGLGLLSTTLNSIYTAAVYRYAVNGEAGEFFDTALVSNAFRQK